MGGTPTLPRADEDRVIVLLEIPGLDPTSIEIRIGHGELVVCGRTPAGETVTRELWLGDADVNVGPWSVSYNDPLLALSVERRGLWLED